MRELPFEIVDIALHERGVVLRLPFRFGIVTLTACPQAFARVRIRTADGRQAQGGAAQLLAPKWFDKNPALSNEQNFDQLRRALWLARSAYLAGRGARPAFGHSAAHHEALRAAGAAEGLNPLVAGFGPALLDCALLDAACRALDVSFYAAVQANVPGLDARLTPDLAGFDLDAFLASLAPAPRIGVRHTVGLVDPIDASDARERVADGLPETLQEVIAAYGCRWFKLKVSGDADLDIARLTRIARVLEPLPDYAVTMDGNEQFADAAQAHAFWQRLQATPALARLAAATRCIEQPLPRAIALASDIRPLAAARPVLIDESDATLDAFLQAIAHGYTGVSSKTCKGLYRSLLNAARCRQRNGAAGGPYFLSAEDLTTQAGLAVQQDLALVNLIGLAHVERNGHHYVDGFKGQGAGPAERQAFLQAQPGLYAAAADNVRLAVHDGQLDLSSLARPGFASAAMPDWDHLPPLAAPAASPTP